MNLATGYLDLLKDPYATSLPVGKAVVVGRTQPIPVIGSYYTHSSSTGIFAEKEYWQMVDAYKSWAYTCIDKIAKSVAMIPLHLNVYRSKQTGKLIRDIGWKALYRSIETKDERKYFLKNQNLEKEEIFDHPFLDLINRPNPFMTRMLLWWNTLTRLELFGMCPWLKVRDGLRVPRKLFPLPLTRSASIKPKVLSTGDVEYWEYRDGNVLLKIFPSDIVLMMYPNPASPFQGMSPLLAQSYPYDIDLFLMQQQRTLFEKGAMPGLVLTTEQSLVQEQVDEIKEMIREGYAGPLKSGETMVLHSGLTPTPMGLTGRELMIDKVAKDAREKLITSFDLSPGKVGLVSDVNRANMAGLDRIFIHECLRPKCMNVEESVEAFLLPDYDKGLTCDFELPSTEDEELELKKRESRLKTFMTTVNMENAAEGREPVPWGDKPWGSWTDAQIGKVIPPSKIPPVAEEEEVVEEEEEEEEKTKLSLLHFKKLDKHFWSPERKDIYWKGFVKKGENLERMILVPLRDHFSTQKDEVLQRLDGEGKKILSQLEGWSRRKADQYLKANKGKIEDINIDREKEKEVLVEKFAPIVKAIMKEEGDDQVRSLLQEIKAVGIDFNVNDPTVLKWLGSRMRQFSEQVAGTTFDRIEVILREGFSEGLPLTAIADELRTEFEGYDKYRAPLIARTETMSAMNRADLDAVRQTELEDKLLKGWLSARDDHCRPSHEQADKKYEDGIPIDENFVVGGDEMEAPGQGQLPEENINCRCTLIYFEKEE